MFSIFAAPKLTRARMAFAMTVAVIVDVIQFGLGPLGVTFIDEIADVFAMALISWAVGFHPLLLPTFLIELVPLVDIVPTWTGCTLAVLMLRKRADVGKPGGAGYSSEPPPIKRANVLHEGPPEE